MLRWIFTAAIFWIALSGCIQTENSNSMDDLIYGTADGSAGFGAVRFILAQNCASCHPYHTMSEQALKDAGVVVGGGDPTLSSIYYRLKGSVGGSGPKNMPTTGGLTPSDLSQIRDWLGNIP